MLQNTERAGKALRGWGLPHTASNMCAPSRADKGTANNSASAIRISLSKDEPLWFSG